MLILAIFRIRLDILDELSIVILDILTVWIGCLLLEGMLVGDKLSLIELEILSCLVYRLGAFLSLSWYCKGHVLRSHWVTSGMKLLYALGKMRILICTIQNCSLIELFSTIYSFCFHAHWYSLFQICMGTNTIIVCSSDRSWTLIPLHISSISIWSFHTHTLIDVCLHDLILLICYLCSDGCLLSIAQVLSSPLSWLSYPLDCLTCVTSCGWLLLSILTCS